MIVTGVGRPMTLSLLEPQAASEEGGASEILIEGVRDEGGVSLANYKFHFRSAIGLERWNRGEGQGQYTQNGYGQLLVKIVDWIGRGQTVNWIATELRVDVTEVYDPFDTKLGIGPQKERDW